MSQEIYLISKDEDLISHFEKQGGANGTGIKPLQTPSAIDSKKLPPCPLFVIDSEGSWEKTVKTLKKMGKKEGKEFYAIISGSASLKKSASCIHEILDRLNGYAGGEGSKKDNEKAEKESELHLSQLLEKKISHFLRRIKHTSTENVYDLLISEVERPLFDLVLKETNGNRVRAAELLGVHRNTLGKKIKEFKIKVVKCSKTR